MSQTLRVLIVEDSELDARVLVALIQAGGYKVHSTRVETAAQLSQALAGGEWDVILADYNLPQFNAPAALELLRQSQLDIPFIVISGGIGEDLAVRIMKSGAHDYLMKGSLARLVPAVEREVREARERAAHRESETALQAAQEQMRIARDIQQRLFPSAPPALSGFDLAGVSLPADETGGDYFDFIAMPDGMIGLVVGDVTGHGIGPALLMAETRAYLRILTQQLGDVGAILTHANRVLAQDVGGERFVTLLLAQLDPTTRAVRYANAGHVPGLCMDKHGATKYELRRTNMPLGLRADTQYRASEPIVLAPGDVLALMTDGVEESLDAQQELFGRDRVKQVLAAQRTQPACVMVDCLHRAAREHIGEFDQPDDYTTIILKVSEMS